MLQLDKVLIKFLTSGGIMSYATQHQAMEARIKQVLRYVEEENWKFNVSCGMSNINPYHLYGPMRLIDNPKIKEAQAISNSRNAHYRMGKKPLILISIKKQA